MRHALIEYANALAAVVSERVGHRRRQIEDAAPVARLVLVDLHAPFAVRQDGAERPPVEHLARREPAGARVLEDERRPAGQRAMGADQLARLDVLVRARQVLAGQMVAGIAEPRGQAAVVVHRRQPEEGGQDEPAELEEQRHDATFAGSWSIAARRAAMLAGVVPQQPPTAAAPASTSATA